MGLFLQLVLYNIVHSTYGILKNSSQRVVLNSILISVTLITVLFYKIIQVDHFLMRMAKVVAVFNSLKVEERVLFC